MSDYATSLIRTYVPLAVGAVVAWLAARGITVDEGTQVALGITLTGLATGVYYAVARALESRWPAVGRLLLGSARKPVYQRPE